MKRKILLTGATGFVGSNLLAALLDKGFEVICLIRTRRGEGPGSRLFRSLEGCFSGKRQVRHALSQVTVMQGDITKENLGVEPSDYRMLTKQISSVFHCAASTEFHPLPSRELWGCNVQGMENIIRLALEGSSIKDFHYISTAYVAGTRDGVIFEDELDTGQKFNNEYEESKFMAETILNRYRKDSDVKITIYRPSIIVGHSCTGKTTLFNGMYLFLRLLYLLKKRYQTGSSAGKTVIPLRVVGGPQTTKNFVPIDYVIRMVMKIFVDPHAWGKTYHLINTTPPTLDHIKVVMEEILAVEGIQFVNREAFDLSQTSRMEQWFARETASYSSYMLKEPIFDDRLAGKLRSEEWGSTTVLLDREALVRLFAYAIDSHWGKRVNGQFDAMQMERTVSARAHND